MYYRFFITHTLRTSWASQGAAKAVDWPRPAQYYLVRSTTNNSGMRLFFTLLIMHQPTNGSKFLFSKSRDMSDTKTRKNAKATVILLEEKKARFKFVCYVQIRGYFFRTKLPCKTERGIAEKPTFIVDTWYLFYARMEMMFWQCLLMGGELGSLCRLSRRVFSQVNSPIFVLIGIDNFNTNFVLYAW